MSKLYAFPTRVCTSAHLKRKFDDAQGRQELAPGWFAAFKDRYTRQPLPLSDRVKIANGIEAAIERLESELGVCREAPFSRTALMRHALTKYGRGDLDPGLDNPTKRLREVTIRTEEMAEERRAAALAAYQLPYAKVIASILDLSREAPAQILEGIFEGTTLTEDERDVASAREIAMQLARRLARADRVFKDQCGRSMAEVYEEAAARKAAHQRQGGRINWPFFELDARDEPGAQAEELPDWRHPYWAANHAVYGWRAPTCLDWLHAINFLPRYFLGSGFLIDDWLSPAAAGDRTKVDRARAALTAQCLAAQDGAGQWKPLAGPGSELMFLSSEQRLLSCPAGPAGEDPMGQMWLVIYPDRDDTSRLCPMLYWNQGEGGVHAVVLNGRNLDRLDAVNVVPPGEERAVRLNRYLMQLLRDPGDEIFLGWTRSALDLLDNPFSRLPADDSIDRGQGTDSESRT